MAECQLHYLILDFAALRIWTSDLTAINTSFAKPPLIRTQRHYTAVSKFLCCNTNVAVCSSHRRRALPLFLLPPHCKRYNNIFPSRVTLVKIFVIGENSGEKVSGVNWTESHSPFTVQCLIKPHRNRRNLICRYCWCCLCCTVTYHETFEVLKLKKSSPPLQYAAQAKFILLFMAFLSLLVTERKETGREAGCRGNIQ